MASRGRVALVSARFLPMLGGTENHVAELAPRLTALGYRAVIVTTDPSHELERRDRHSDVPVRRYDAWPRHTDLHFAPGVLRGILGGRYDLVHLQGVHTLVAPLVMAAAAVARVPFVVTFHTGGHPSPIRTKMRSLQWLMLRPLLRRAAAVVAVSRFERDVFARLLGLEPTRIRVIPNGVDGPTPSVEGREDPDLIVSVGRLEWYKGHHRAIQALPFVLAARPNTRLLVMGSGPAEAGLRHLACDLGVSDRVEIRYFPPERRSEMQAIVGSAALVVLMSEYEAHPLAVTEALALGRRVVVADTTGLSEIAEAGLAGSVAIDAGPSEVAAELLRSLQARRSGEPPPLPTWDDVAIEVDGLYQSVLGRVRKERS